MGYFLFRSHYKNDGWFGFMVLYFVLLNIYRWINITNIVPHSPEDGSFKPKRYSVNFASQ